MVIVDVSNVLHTQGVLPADLAGIDLDGLIRLLVRSRYRGRPARLVCDGARRPVKTPKEDRGGDLRVLFSGPQSDADTVIQRLVQTDPDPRRVLVVSTDRAVRRHARRWRASVLRSDAFLRQLATDARRPATPALPAFARDIPLDRYSVESWMQRFGLGDNDPLLRLLATQPQPSERRRSTADGERPPAREDSGKRPVDAGAPHSEEEAGLRPNEPVDPLLLDALEEWADRMSLDDLDMRRWLGEHPERGPQSPEDET